MKNRKQLPCFGYLSNMKIDMPALLKHLEDNKLLDFDNYNDIRLGGKMNDWVTINEFCHTNFFKEDNAPLLNADKIRHIMLTDFDESKRSNLVTLKNTNIFERTKRSDPNSPNYLPEADELNYGIRNELVTGELEKILDMFSSKVTKVRLAYLAGSHEIKPHVDYDPTYIVRFHIPIITNPGVIMYMDRKGTTLQMHMPPDGRVYFFNAGMKHWVKNESDQARLHLIIDVHGQTELDHLVSLDEESLATL